MEPRSRVFVFGDQTNAYEEQLKPLLHLSSNVVLKSFVDNATHALRAEIGRLPAQRRKHFPRFATLIDLLAARRQHGIVPALELPLLCITQLGCFIRYHTETARPFPSGGDSLTLGLCTGSFAAAAISASSTLSELVPAAIQAVLVAFRTGLRTAEARDDVEGCPSGSPVWTAVVGGDEAAVASAVAAFCERRRTSSSAQLFISAVGPNNVTVSGPSLLLDDFFAAPEFSRLGSSKSPLPIHSPFHAPHLYDARDIDAILGVCNPAILDGHRHRIPLISSSTGKSVPADSLRALLRTALHDVLTQRLRWDLVLRESNATIGDSSHVDVLPVLANAQNFVAAISTSAREVNVVPLDSPRESISWNGSAGDPAQSKIAIIGYSGRFPDAASADKLWHDVLIPGKDVHREIPANRFDVDTHTDPTGQKKNTSRVRYGCFIEEPGLFDARFFNMSPRESCNADPAQRLSLAAAYESLEMAGFVGNTSPSTQKDRVGIFMGTTSDDWRECNSGQDVDTYYIPGACRAFTPGRINYHFKFAGPSLSIDTACSSSLAAIHTACNSLWRGDSDACIAGGTNVLTNPDGWAGLDRGHFLSTTGNCNTFDDGANGYCRADSVGTVVLKRLEDAIADNDPIKGVICTAYTNHSAESESITRPHVGAQAYIFNKLLAETGTSPLDVSYIEMHGTGTQAGDAVEMGSVLQTFAPGKRGSDHPLYLGSVKANVGHAESASGVTALIKVLKMMEKSLVPPHCGIKTKINHNFPTDLAERNVHIAFKATPWERPTTGLKKRMAFVNNFSAAGGNSSLLIEDAPARELLQDPNEGVERGRHLVAISGKGKVSVKKNTEALIQYLDSHPNISPSALAYTTTARRLHHGHRVIANGWDLASIRASLQTKLADCDSLKPIPVAAKIPKVNFAFTGQGALYTALGNKLYNTESSFRQSIQRLDRMAHAHRLPSFLGLVDGSITTLDDVSPVITQTGIVAVQIALAQLWMAWGVAPNAVIGHSLGEYAALHVAGVISASDALFLAGTRAQIFEQKCKSGTHGMLAVKASLQSLGAHLTGSGCEVACINGPDDTVLSGATEKIEALSKTLSDNGKKTTRLNVPFAFHSPQVEAIMEDFQSAAKGATYRSPTIPFFSPLLGEVVKAGDGDILTETYLTRAARETVNFQRALLAAQEAGTIESSDIWLEMGPHPICLGMVKATLGPSTGMASLRRNADDWETINDSVSSLYLAGVEIDWTEFHRDSKARGEEVLQLPAYQWDHQNYWIQYRGDFCLYKGDHPLLQGNAPPQQAPTSALSTAAVQRVVEQQIGKDKSSITIESDINHPDLAGTIKQHQVNTVSLCPSSLWADVVLTLSHHLLEESGMSGDDKSTDVRDMAVTKPLIANGKQQLFRATAEANWKAGVITADIYSVDSSGKKLDHHASCNAVIGSIEQWIKDWQRSIYLIKGRLDALDDGVAHGQSHRIKRGLAYKLFSSFVDYGNNYQGMEEVTFDSNHLEASALVKFKTTEKEENHWMSPYWIDSLGHIAGFIMNANDSVVSKDTVFVNHGWEGCRMAKRFDRSKTYRNYNRMQNVGGTMYAGDTWIFDAETMEVVAIFFGVKFQGVPRKVLDGLLPAGIRQAAKAAPNAPPKVVTKQASKPKKPKKEKAQVAVQIDESCDVASKVLALVADEAGVDQASLTPDAVFADLGVDSLLSLNITGRMREDLGVEVPSEFFTEHPTVADIVKHLAPSSSAASSPTTRPTTAAPTPDDSTDDVDSDDTDPTDLSDVDADDESEPEMGPMATIKQIIAEEVGIDESEIDPTLDLGELGVDSLLSLNILEKLSDKVDIDLPPGLFANNGTLNEVEKALGLSTKKPVAKPSKSATSAKPTPASTRPSSPKPSNGKTIPPSSSVLLQGNVKTASKILFLFPDGSGAAVSYAPLPRVSPDIAVIGLNCPYMRNASDMKCNISDITPSYLAEVRRRQPKGPYYFGGWSAGGICALDAAQQLDREGEKVSKLILIDSPNPIGLEKLPPRLFDWAQSVGMFGEGPPPKWLLPHFAAFLDALDMYKPRPYEDMEHAPATQIIWAKDGLCKSPEDPRPEMRDDDPREMKWLLNNRTEFGPNGWDRLLDPEKIKIEVMENANHFTMMNGERAEDVAALIRRVVEE